MGKMLAWHKANWAQLVCRKVWWLDDGLVVGGFGGQGLVIGKSGGWRVYWSVLSANKDTAEEGTIWMKLCCLLNCCLVRCQLYLVPGS